MNCSVFKCTLSCMSSLSSKIDGACRKLVTHLTACKKYTQTSDCQKRRLEKNLLQNEYQILCIFTKISHVVLTATVIPLQLSHNSRKVIIAEATNGTVVINPCTS